MSPHTLSVSADSPPQTSADALWEERKRALYDDHPDPMFLVDLEEPMPLCLPGEEQADFLTAVETPLSRGDFDAANSMCEGDERAMCQLVHLAIINRKIGYNKVRQLVVDRFQRDVLADLEHRLAWVNTVIKSAPMLGLLGTVIGMMGAFAKLATAETVDPAELASNIQTALITTACGLAIAIPLVLCTASINVRIRKLEDLVGAGLTRFFDAYRVAIDKLRG